MPQLDILSYSTQIFWLLICFISFYFIVLKNILPAILLNIKVRENIINTIAQDNDASALEIKQVNETFIKSNLLVSDKLEDCIGVLTTEVQKHLKYIPIFVTIRANNEIITQTTKEVFSSKKISNL